MSRQKKAPQTKKARLITEVLSHYRCPHCGRVGADLCYDEAQIQGYKYDTALGRWLPWGAEPLTDRYDIELPEMFTLQCGNCGNPISGKTGEPISVYPDDSFDDWLKDLCERWRAQCTEREELRAKLAAALLDIPRHGTIADLQSRIAQLDTIF